MLSFPSYFWHFCSSSIDSLFLSLSFSLSLSLSYLFIYNLCIYSQLCMRVYISKNLKFLVIKSFNSFIYLFFSYSMQLFSPPPSLSLSLSLSPLSISLTHSRSLSPPLSLFPSFSFPSFLLIIFLS